MKKKLESFSSFKFNLKENQAKSIMGGYGGTGCTSMEYYWTSIGGNCATQDSRVWDQQYDV